MQELQSIGALVAMLNETFSGLLNSAPGLLNSSAESQVIHCVDILLLLFIMLTVQGKIYAKIRIVKDLKIQL